LISSETELLFICELSVCFNQFTNEFNICHTDLEKHFVHLWYLRQVSPT
jgi:hypothetical protein